MTKNANDSLRGYTNVNNVYNYAGNMVISDGVRALCEQFECYWFIDIVASYQVALRKEREKFQVWHLQRYDDNSALVECTDGGERKIRNQVVDSTDFKPREATVWVQNNLICLPSEED
jgi:uncharacterized repeat protein (TIGR04076 family)